MASLKKFLQIIKIIIKNPRVLGYVYQHNDPTKDYVIKKYKLKNGLPTIDFLDILPEFRETIINYTGLSQGSTITDYGLLKSLAKKIKNVDI